MDILTIISLPIHEYGLSFHLFIFFLISFISVLYCQYTSLSLQFIPKYFIVLDTLVNEIFNFPYLFNSISFCFIYVCIYIYIQRERDRQIDIPHLYPFLCQLTLSLLPCTGYYKQCYNQCWGRYVFSNYGFLWIYTKEWDC